MSGMASVGRPGDKDSVITLMKEDSEQEIEDDS